MLEIIFDNWKYFSKIFLIIIIFIIINSYLIITSTKEYIIDNWEYFKKQSWFIPFSAFIKKDEDKTILQATIKNIVSYLTSVVNKILYILSKPIYPIIKTIQLFLKIIREKINDLRKQFRVIRNFFYIMLQNIYDKLQKKITALMYFFLKIRESLKKNIGLFKMLSWTITSSYFFLMSMLNGPIGTVGKFAEQFGLAMSGFTLGFPGIALWQNNMCFHPNTLIKLNNNHYKKLSNIHLNDILIDNNKVIAICIFDITNIKNLSIYNYKDIIVSGNHLVYENNKFIRVKDSKKKKNIFYDSNKLLCLVTQSGIIKINDIIFKDYLDTHDKHINHDIHQIIENKLNNNSLLNFSEPKERDPDLLWGICENTYIYDNFNQKYIKINELNIGTIINNTKIIGIIKIDKFAVTPYIYEKDNQSIILSGNQLIKENNMWIRVSKSKYTNKLYHTDYDNMPNFISFVTNNNKIIIGQLEIADFFETNDNKTNKIIDQHVLSSLQ